MQLPRSPMATEVLLSEQEVLWSVLHVTTKMRCRTLHWFRGSSVRSHTVDWNCPWNIVNWQSFSRPR